MCVQSWNETKDPDPAHFAGDEFLDSPIAFENGTVVALVHTEYPGGVTNLSLFISNLACLALSGHAETECSDGAATGVQSDWPKSTDVRRS